MTRATVNWFNKTKGFGFATAEGIEGDVMIHQSQIQMEGFRFLHPKQIIEIETIEESPQGLRAVGITKVEEA